MKTAEEKAENWLFNNMPGFDVRDNDDDIKSLVILLKEQDRDTRHACAEAVASLSDEGCLDKAADACMNVKAV